MSHCGMPDEAMQKKLNQARKLGHWLYIAPRDLWITPNDLEELQLQDQLCWMAQNWVVLSPEIRRKQIQKKILLAKQELRDFERKLDRQMEFLLT